MLFSEWSEYDSLKFIQTFLRSDDKFLDIGANVGLFSLLASESIPSTSIFCIEPGTSQRNQLRENFELNSLSGVSIYPYAVGECGSTIALTKEDAISHVVDPGSETNDHETVELRRLDSFLPVLLYQLTKIDVEGFELPGLRGARSLIESGLMPVILLELNGSSERFGIQTSELVDFLESLGYRMGMYDHDECLLSLSDRLWDDVVAFTDLGESLIKDRIPNIRIK